MERFPMVGGPVAMLVLLVALGLAVSSVVGGAGWPPHRPVAFLVAVVCALSLVVAWRAWTD